MFGAVNSRGGQTRFQLSAHKRSVDFREFIDNRGIPAYPQADLSCLFGETVTCTCRRQYR